MTIMEMQFPGRYSRNSYLKKSTPRELYSLAEHWKSDLLFYKEEIHFFHNLIDTYFKWMTKDENIDKVKKVSRLLSRLKRDWDMLSFHTDEHLKDLELLMENPFSHDETRILENHLFLEEKTAEFLADYRWIKKEIFSITQLVIESEKLQHLLGI